MFTLLNTKIYNHLILPAYNRALCTLSVFGVCRYDGFSFCFRLYLSCCLIHSYYFFIGRFKVNLSRKFSGIFFISLQICSQLYLYLSCSLTILLSSHLQIYFWYIHFLQLILHTRCTIPVLMHLL